MRQHPKARNNVGRTQTHPPFILFVHKSLSFLRRLFRRPDVFKALVKRLFVRFTQKIRKVLHMPKNLFGVKSKEACIKELGRVLENSKSIDARSKNSKKAYLDSNQTFFRGKYGYTMEKGMPTMQPHTPE